MGERKCYSCHTRKLIEYFCKDRNLCLDCKKEENRLYNLEKNPKVNEKKGVITDKSCFAYLYKTSCRTDTQLTYLQKERVSVFMAVGV